MGKKKKRKKNTKTKVVRKTIELKQPIGIPVSDSEPHQTKQHFKLLSFPMISLREDYDVYRILIGEKTVIGYFGVFKSGIFNYVVVREKNEIDETHLLRFLKNFIRDSGLTQMLNPHMKEYL